MAKPLYKWSGFRLASAPMRTRVMQLFKKGAAA